MAFDVNTILALTLINSKHSFAKNIIDITRTVNLCDVLKMCYRV